MSQSVPDRLQSSAGEAKDAPASSSSIAARERGARNGGRVVAALTTGVIAVLAFVLAPDAASPRAGAASAHWPVGHTVERMIVQGSANGELRRVDVHLWYPAEDTEAFAEAATTSYTSTLHGRPLGYSAPLSWRVSAEIAREGVPIAAAGPEFPVIVFSHGNTNEPIDHAHTLERIASAGFVVAAPTHVNNSQDDVRIDYVNGKVGALPISCRDGLPGPCSRTDVPRSMQDRARDIERTLDELPGWLKHGVDTSRVGVMGHSRGTVAALVAVGGSEEWMIEPVDGKLPAAKRRIKAVMGLASAVRRFTLPADLADVEVPTLLLAGALDLTSPVEVSQEAFEEIGADDKELVVIDKARHRTFNSTYCAQAQAAGAIAHASADADLDRHTLARILNHPRSGRAVEYCSRPYFKEPANIQGIVKEMTEMDFNWSDVPTTGLDADTVKGFVADKATSFFGAALGPSASADAP